MKVLQALRDSTGTVRVAVHLDETKTVEIEAAADGVEPELVPDPEYILDLAWGGDIEPEVIARETALIAAAEAARRGVPTPVASIEAVDLDLIVADAKAGRGGDPGLVVRPRGRAAGGRG